MGGGTHTFSLALWHPDVEVETVLRAIAAVLGDSGLQAALLEVLGLQGPWGEPDGRSQSPCPSRPAAPLTMPTATVPTLPAWMSLRLLQDLGSSCIGDPLKDIYVVTEEPEFLVDTFHEAAFCVHGSQL